MDQGNGIHQRSEQQQQQPIVPLRLIAAVLRLVLRLDVIVGAT